MKVQQERMDAYLKKINGSPCPLCGQKRWQISNTVFQAIEFDTKGLILGGGAYPIVPLTCMNCGNTYFINALVADLIDRPTDDADDIAPMKDSERGGSCD